jgi:hypothetical protein
MATRESRMARAHVVVHQRRTKYPARDCVGHAFAVTPMVQSRITRALDRPPAPHAHACEGWLGAHAA